MRCTRGGDEVLTERGTRRPDSLAMLVTSSGTGGTALTQSRTALFTSASSTRKSTSGVLSASM